MKSDTPEHLAVSDHCAVNMDAVADIGQVRLPCILTGTPCGRLDLSDEKNDETAFNDRY